VTIPEQLVSWALVVARIDARSRRERESNAFMGFSD